MEYESVTQEVLFGNATLIALMSGRKYDVIPQNGNCGNVHTLGFRNKVRYHIATHVQRMLSDVG